MNIVVLDGYLLNPGDLSWEEMAQFGKLTVYERTPADQVVERAADADILLTNKTLLPGAVLQQLPRLVYIGVLATGYNVVDVEEAKERGITVTNVPDYSTQAVAQLVFAFILEHCQHVQRHADAVREGEWSRSADFSFTRFPLNELAGKSLGVIGFGLIGQQTARLGHAFGMRVKVSTRTVKKIPGLEFAEFVSLEELLQTTDFVSIHCALTPETTGLINKNSLALMKPNAFLINTARGGVIVEQDLANALNAGGIAGAGLDVLSTEPPAPTNPLLQAANALITPHLGWETREARSRCMGVAVANIRGFLDKKPQNVVAGPGAAKI